MISPDHQHHINKQKCRAAFNRAAPNYDDVAVLQREVGCRMMDRLGLMKLNPKTITDIGAGTGHGTLALRKQFPQAHLIAVDIASRMLMQARSKNSWLEKNIKRKQHFVCGDAEDLPLGDNSFDLLYSNLTLQWCNDLDRSFTEFTRVLNPGGALVFSTMGPDTLMELRRCWAQADNLAHIDSHVHAFIDMHDIGDALMRAGFADPVMDVEKFTLTYPSVQQLMRELKTLGAHNVANSRQTGLTGKKRLQAMIDNYEQLRKDGVLPATYEVVYGHAWCADANVGNAPQPVRVAPPSPMTRANNE